MSRVLVTLAATVIGVVWLVTFRVTPLEVDALPAPTPAPTRQSVVVPTLPGRTVPPVPTQATAVAAGTPAASGTFTGATISTIYGPVQVRITVSAQKVVDIQAMALPRDRARSAAISQYSAPILRTEAITAQSASIDIVSGATYTSIAYARSLDNALKQAHLG